MHPDESAWWQLFGERGRHEDDGWWVCAGLSLHEAELLLDWLESKGIGHREVAMAGDGVTVRWRG